MAKSGLEEHQSNERGLDLIRQALTAAVDKVGPELLAQLTKAYRGEADARYERILELLGDSSVKGPIGKSFTVSDYWNWFKLKGPSSYRSIITWEDLRAARKDVTHPGYEKADRQAKDSYEGARESFIYKNVDKFKSVLGDREDVSSVDIDFNYRAGAFEGSLEVKLSDTTVYAEVSLKYVVRTNPRVTPYYQYPLIFKAQVDGRMKSLSEEELRVRLGGESLEKLAEKKAAEAAAAGFCPMSGKGVPAGTPYGRYVKCPSCGLTVSVQNWKFRKHKTAVAAKLDAAEKLTADGYCPMSRQKVSQATIDSMGPVDGYKDPKVYCERCGQMARLDAKRDWIRDQFLSPDGYATKMKVTAAKYYKHKMG